MTTIYLVRHGKVTYKDGDYIYGRKNIELDKDGLKQVSQLREKILNYDFDVCYSSPLIRCVETAFTLIGDRCLMLRDDRLIERDMGQLVDKHNDDYDRVKYWDYSLNCSDLDVEPIQDVYKRSKDFLEYILEKYPDKKVLVVSHSAIIKNIIKVLDNKKTLKDIPYCYFEEFSVDNLK